MKKFNFIAWSNMSVPAPWHSLLLLIIQNYETLKENFTEFSINRKSFPQKILDMILRCVKEIKNCFPMYM